MSKVAPPPVVSLSNYDRYSRHAADRRTRTSHSTPAPEATPSKPVWRARQGSRPRPKSRSRSNNAISYLGVDNLMRSYPVTQKRTWRSADDTSGAGAPPRPDGRGYGDQMSDNHCWTETNPGELRKSRKSSFSRYTYPAKFHRSAVPGGRQSVEELIPLCLRQYPQYSRQPVRQSCAYGPPSSVTFSALHVVRSLNLPHSATRQLHGNRASATFKAQPSARLAGSASSAADCHDTGSISDDAGSDDTADRNGVYHCVYPGRATDVTIVVDPAADSNYEGDFEDDEEEGEKEDNDNRNPESDYQDSPRGSGTTPVDSSRESRHSDDGPDSSRQGRSRSRSPESLLDSNSDRSVDELVQQYKRQVQITQNDISSASEVED